jgi:ABC-type transport system involved in multi-copper enzyme maturation permease subunit
MINLIAAEFRRLRSTRLWLLALLLAVIFGGGIVALLALIGPHNLQPPLPGLDTSAGATTILGLISITIFIPAVLGTVAVTSEYRHRTITPTFLAVPRRWRVLVAKLITFGLGGAGYGLISSSTAVGGVLAACALRGQPLGLGAGDVVGFMARVVLTSAIYTLIGVAVGALLRNQVLAVLVVLGYFYFLETLLLIIPGVNALYPFLPGGATSALIGFSFLTDQLGDQLGWATTLLPSAGAALVLLGYAAAAAFAAIAVPLRRDIG